MNATVIERIMEIKKKERFTNESLASASGLSVETIKSMFSKKTNPSIDTLLKISSAFPLYSLEWLLTGHGTMLKSPTYGDVLEAIRNKVKVSCPGINPEWLLTGKGEPKLSDEKPVTVDKESASDKKIPANKMSGEIRPGTKAVHLYDVSAVAGYKSFDEIISHERILDTFVIPTFKDISWLIYVKGSSMYPKYSSGDIIACRVLYESRFIQWGKVYVVAIREQGILVKRLEESKNKNCIKAISDNPAYKPFDIPKDEIFGIALVIGVIRME